MFFYLNFFQIFKNLVGMPPTPPPPPPPTCVPFTYREKACILRYDVAMAPPSRVQKKLNKNKIKLGLLHFTLYVHKNVHLRFKSKYSRNIPNSAWLALNPPPPAPHSSPLPSPWLARRTTELVPGTPPPPALVSSNRAYFHSNILTYPACAREKFDGLLFQECTTNA